jgi:hypothetical protein
MKILHVASFIGNIGDNASHLGLRIVLNKLISHYEISPLEMRKFYGNYRHDDKLRFDEKFVEYANGFDMMIIGGGGFLDYWVQGSRSGTTIDIAPELVGALAVPTLITSVGCMPHKDVPEGNVEKFRRFLDAVASNPKLRLAVRNDGSKLALRCDIGERYGERVPEVLDHGFFYDSARRPDILPDGDYVAVNITSDQIRMNSTLRGELDSDRYYSELAVVCRHVTQELGLHIVFVPHIHSDLGAISELVGRLDDFTIREKVTVAPCIQGDDGANWLFGVYKHSRLVLATRLHANICSLAMGRPTLGLVAIDRVKHIYDGLGRPDDCVVLDGVFSRALCRKVDSVLLEDAHPLVELESKKRFSLELYRRWFGELGLA